ncbi:MAG: glycosyltransferase family 2 protein [bacterium]
MKPKLTFAVIVPCFNEVKNIEACVFELLALELFDRVVVVDDASTDGTGRLLWTLQNRFTPRLQAFFLPKNGGKNQAVRFAAQCIECDVIVIYDADLTIAPASLRAVVSLFKQDPNRFVFGSRFADKMEKGAMPRLNRWGNLFFAFWMSRLLGRKISDVLCGVKAISRVNFLDLPPSNCRWGDFDLMFGAASKNLAFHEVPLFYQRRRADQSKMHVIRSGLSFFFKCLRYTYQTSLAK